MVEVQKQEGVGSQPGLGCEENFKWNEFVAFPFVEPVVNSKALQRKWWSFGKEEVPRSSSSQTASGQEQAEGPRNLSARTSSRSVLPWSSLLAEWADGSSEEGNFKERLARFCLQFRGDIHGRNLIRRSQRQQRWKR